MKRREIEAELGYFVENLVALWQSTDDLVWRESMAIGEAREKDSIIEFVVENGVSLNDWSSRLTAWIELILEAF